MGAVQGKCPLCKKHAYLMKCEKCGQVSCSACNTPPSMCPICRHKRVVIES